MSDCCSSRPTEARCPRDGSRGSEVPWRTVLLHLAAPRRAQFPEQTYYFCNSPECGAVYFGLDGTVIEQSDLRTVIGIKSTVADAPLCYCFDISRAEALADPAAREYVIEQTRRRLCSCDSANPAGRCCLQDFPR